MKPDDDILPPHSESDEFGILACVIQDPSRWLPECGQISENSFYEVRSKLIWRGIQSLANNSRDINTVTVEQWLKENSEFANPRAILSEIDNSIPSSSNFPYYLPKVLDLELRRRIIRDCSTISAQARNGHTTAQVLDSCEQLLSIKTNSPNRAHDGKKAGDKFVDDLQRRHELQGALSGMDTGFNELNEALDGFQFGEQTIIGARPSIGKTAIGLNIFQHAAFVNKIPSLFISLEMPTEALMRRMCANRHRIPMKTLRRGTYSESDFKNFAAFRIECGKSPMHIIDGINGMTIGEICAQIRWHVKKYGVKFAVVDYLQKVKPAQREEKKTQEIADISEKLRAVAIETKIAFLALAQLNRESEKDKPRMPRLSDLAESASLERDGDVIILLHRKRDNPAEPATLLIAKARDCDIGVVKLNFIGEYCRFENAPRESRHYEQTETPMDTDPKPRYKD